jgi:hypothetical protein
MVMTKGDNIGLVILWNTSPNDLIGTVLKGVWIVPKEVFHLIQQLGPILLHPMRRHLTSDKIVHNISKPR